VFTSCNNDSNLSIHFSQQKRWPQEDEAKKEKETINKMPSLYNSISKFASRLILLLRRNFELK
jgi:hypothetical protein